jgi:hypothetical protein
MFLKIASMDFALGKIYFGQTGVEWEQRFLVSVDAQKVEGLLLIFLLVLC